MKKVVPSYGGGTSKQVLQLKLDSFSQGLNLAANPYQLKDGETPDCLNVDLDQLGGIKRRKSMAVASGTAPTGDFDGVFTYTQSSGSQAVLFGLRSGVNTKLRRVSAPTTDITTVTAAQLRSITMNSLCYIAAGHTSPTLKYDGASVTTLGDAKVDDPAAYTNGNFPRGKLMATFQGSAWSANILESSVAYPCKIRWSWPNEPENWPTWATETYDNGEDSDEITALQPHNERLLVFKRNALYAIQGQGPTGFRKVTVSSTIGAISQEAVCKTDTDVYFFSWPDGLYRIGAAGVPQPVFDRLRPILTDGSIPQSAKDKITVSWVNRRVWVSVPWTAGPEGANRNGRTFCYDPALDGWTAHDYGMNQATVVIPSNQDVYAIAPVTHPSIVGSHTLAKMEQAGDTDLAGGYPIYGRYQSSWLDAGDPMLPKRWRKVGMILSNTALLTAETRFDFSNAANGTFTVAPIPVVGGAWNQNWGAFSWTADLGSNSQRINQGRSAGKGRAISVVIRNSNTGNWQMSSMTVKYLTRRRRD